MDNRAAVAAASASGNASVGWSEPRSFFQQLTALSVGQDSTLFLVVIVTGCTGVQVATTSPMLLYVDQSPPDFDYTENTYGLAVSSYPQLLYASWPQVLDAESGVDVVYGQFFIDGVVASNFVDVTHVLELSLPPAAVIPDGSNVTFGISARNGAGVVFQQNATGIVDGSPAICGVVQVGLGK